MSFLSKVGASAPPRNIIPPVAVKLNSDVFKKRRVAHSDKTVLELTQKSKWAKKLNAKVRPLIADPKLRTFLNEKVEEAKKLDPNYEGVSFDEWYEIIFQPANATEGKTIFTRDDLHLPVHEGVSELTKELHDLPEVDTAYTQSLMVPASLGADAEALARRFGKRSAIPDAEATARRLSKRSVVPWDDPLYNTQAYLNPAPNGIDVNAMWWRAGGEGNYASVTDIEWGWVINHQDLAASNLQLVGTGANDGDRTHGTAVMGEMLMADNTVGGVGIAPKGKGKMVGFNPTIPGQQRNLVTMISEALQYKQPGEVILIEIQIGVSSCSGCGWDGLYRAVEWDQVNYDIIKLATTLGVTVIEPAGNGENCWVKEDPPGSGNWRNCFGSDFDTFTVDGKYYLKRGHPDFRDSGAVMVGASTSSTPHAKTSWSNYGSRIDAYAYGENVVTTMTNSDWEGNMPPGTATDRYTNSFSGTSSASPIIAGAAMLIQSVNFAKTGSYLSPADVRYLLANFGTASQTPATEKIGVMPDLQKIALHKQW